MTKHEVLLLENIHPAATDVFERNGFIVHTRPGSLGEDDLIEALSRPPTRLKAGVLRTLKGVHLAFTGILTRKRREAVRLARKAGAVVHGGPSSRTTVFVRGRPNPLQAAGRDGGLKLMEIKRLRANGHRITLLDETQFWRLAGPPRRTGAAP